MKFSIIVPVYNIADYLDISINSVLNQGFSDFELILVNDGSTDDSLQICKKYEQKDKRIKVIDKENGGVSSARNYGLDTAKGDYVLFLDGDDFFVEECLPKLDHCSNDKPDLDIIACHMDVLINEEYEKNRLSYPLILREINNSERLAYLVKNNLLKWNVFSNLYKRDFIEKHHLRFNEDFVGAEDLDFVFQVYHSGAQIDYCDISICTYRVVRDGSITTNFNSYILLKQIEIFKKWFDVYYFEKDLDANTKHTLCSFFANLIIMKISNTYRVEEEYLNKLLQLLEEYHYILNYPTSRKNRIIVKSYSLFGFIWGSKLLHVYHILFSAKNKW